MKKLGLDLGSSSIGWALREENKIVKKGVITFQSGMVKGKSGYSSPTKDRREARSKRRLIQARKYRKWALLEVLLNEYAPLDKIEFEIWSKYKKGLIQRFPENVSFLKWLACDFTYERGGIKYSNPYELRVKALDNKLSKHEFGRALYHLVQRRGYKNIGENENEEFDIELAKKDAETKTQIERREKDGFANSLSNKRTIAEALKNDFLSNGKRARNQYPLRREYKNELELICKGQGYDISKNEKGEYKNEFIQQIWKAIIWQRPLRSQKGNIGKCTLEPNTPRCPLSHPIFEVFRTLQFINTIRYYDEHGDKQSLPTDLRNQLFEFFLNENKNFKFEKIKIFLDKQFKEKKKYNYPIDKKTGKYDTSVAGMPVCNGLIDVFGDSAKRAIINIDNYNNPNDESLNSKIEKATAKATEKKGRPLAKEEKDNIEMSIRKDFLNNSQKIVKEYSLYDLWHILFVFDHRTAKDKNFLEKFATEKLNIKNEATKKGKEYNLFAELKHSLAAGYADLSLKAMCKIIPFLKEGYLYNEAVALAKLPELLSEKWRTEKDKIYASIKQANEIYNWHKTTVAIVNNLIDQYKGLEHDEKFAHKDFEYILDKDDLKDIEKACKGYFGEKSWESKIDKNEIVAEVKKEYQTFFRDPKRAYRSVPLLTNIFKEKLKESNIEINGELYHHSNIENKYLKKYIDPKTGKVKLPTYKHTNIEILPTPRIDSIKNPMFNKALTILRKLANELIVEGVVDNDTEIIVEVARELNDNNKRAAIERYQNERKNNREKYREFLKEFNERENKSINVEEGISTFELWSEQIFEDTEDDKGKKINKHTSILKEKEAIKRYELWMEQKGQCMYTGKMISITQLFSNDIDIEHTIPRSLLPDNTMANQTVCYAWYNRDRKKNQLPKKCNNYSQDIEGWGTSIEARLDRWIEKRDYLKNLYEEKTKPKGNEDQTAKNKRIQEKHYHKMHYDYWKDKVERFEADEVKDSWARRQLADTQMASKYAREFLKTYFKKVAVQKGSITADFRKMYGFQEEDEIKSRNRHTHHAIDAAVLTLIPTNSSYREKLLKRMYEIAENENRQYTTTPFSGFNSQTIIKEIDNTTLIVNYENDRILKKTYKKIRKRGRLQYLKDKEGKFILDKEGNKIILKADGDAVRTTLFKDTFISKIRDVERYPDGQPMREGEDWKYRQGKDEFTYVVRKPIQDVISKIDDIVDPVIRELVRAQKNNATIKDYQDNIIRHVRVRTSAGKVVKERVNYRSKHNYKNQYYSAAGSIPYAALLQKSNDGKIEREMIPVASFEIAKMNKKHGSFDIEQYVKEHRPDLVNYPDKKLLRVGQKLIVLNDDKEYEKKNDIDFQIHRLYVITKFSEGSIWLKYHLEAQAGADIDDIIKDDKDKLLHKYEIKYAIPEVVEDITIEDKNERKDDYEKRRYSFAQLDNFRFSRLKEKVGIDKVKEIKKELDKFKTQSGYIEIEGKTPLLKMSEKNWNFLYEGEDFKVSLLGELLPIHQSVTT